MSKETKGNQTRDFPENEYGYYSKLLKKPFDTLDELKKAEEEYRKLHEEDLKLKEEKKAAADAIRELEKQEFELWDKVFAKQDEIRAAKLEFARKYGSYHETITIKRDQITPWIAPTITPSIGWPKLGDYPEIINRPYVTVRNNDELNTIFPDNSFSHGPFTTLLSAINDIEKKIQ